MSVIDDIKKQIKAIRRRFLRDEYAAPAIKYIILGEIAYHTLRADLLWPEELEGLLLVIDPLDKKREPLVVCDPIHEILMKVRSPKIYLIEDGALFQGTLAQFKECFFTNANDETIADWCKENGWTLRIIEDEP